MNQRCEGKNEHVHSHLLCKMTPIKKISAIPNRNQNFASDVVVISSLSYTEYSFTGIPNYLCQVSETFSHR